MTTDPKQPEAQEAPASEREAFESIRGAAAFLESTLRTNSRHPDDWYRDVADAVSTIRAALGKQPTQEAPDAWKKAVDDELALCESTVSSFPDARAAVRGLIDWHVRNQEAPADAKDAARYRDALVWALGAGDDFRPQGTMDGKFWWRGELAERAGLTWDGERYIDSALQSHQEGGKP